MYYKPASEIDLTTGKPLAYTSIEHITNDLTLGWLVRGMHRWGASVFVILLFMHMAPRVPVRRLQVPAGAALDHRRPHPRDGDAHGLHGLPAALGPNRLLGDRRRHQPERDRTFRRPVVGAVPGGRPRDRIGHPREVVRTPHAAHPRRADRAHRHPPLPRRAPRHHVAAVVAGSRGRPCSRRAPGRARSAGKGPSSTARRLQAAPCSVLSRVHIH